MPAPLAPHRSLDLARRGIIIIENMGASNVNVNANAATHGHLIWTAAADTAAAAAAAPEHRNQHALYIMATTSATLSLLFILFMLIMRILCWRHARPPRTPTPPSTTTSRTKRSTQGSSDDDRDQAPLLATFQQPGAPTAQAHNKAEQAACCCHLAAYASLANVSHVASSVYILSMLLCMDAVGAATFILPASVIDDHYTVCQLQACLRETCTLAALALIVCLRLFKMGAVYDGANRMFATFGRPIVYVSCAVLLFGVFVAPLLANQYPFSRMPSMWCDADVRSSEDENATLYTPLVAWYLPVLLLLMTYVWLSVLHVVQLRARFSSEGINNRPLPWIDERLKEIWCRSAVHMFMLCVIHLPMVLYAVVRTFSEKSTVANDDHGTLYFLQCVCAVCAPLQGVADAYLCATDAGIMHIMDGQSCPSICSTCGSKSTSELSFDCPHDEDSDDGDEQGAAAGSGAIPQGRGPKCGDAFVDSKHESLRVFCGTWNLGNRPPPPKDTMRTWLPHDGSYDIVAIAAQECAYVTGGGRRFCPGWGRSPYLSLKGEASLADLKAASRNAENKGESCAEHWVRFLQECICPDINADFLGDRNSRDGGGGIDNDEGDRVERDGLEHFHHQFFVPVSCVWMRDICMTVFVRRSLVSHVKRMRVLDEPTGLCRVYTNKGGVTVAFQLGSLSLSFTGVHLAAHIGYMQRRVEDVLQLMRRHLQFGRASPDCAFLFGDLNFRLGTVLPSDSMIAAIHNSDSRAALLRTDELSYMRSRRLLFAEYEEPEIDFLPSYKFRRGSVDNYGSKRLPAYADRILYAQRKSENVEVLCLEYACAFNVSTSDHKPVHASFKVSAVWRSRAAGEMEQVGTAVPVAISFISLRCVNAHHASTAFGIAQAARAHVADEQGSSGGRVVPALVATEADRLLGRGSDPTQISYESSAFKNASVLKGTSNNMIEVHKAYYPLLKPFCRIMVLQDLDQVLKAAWTHVGSERRRMHAGDQCDPEEEQCGSEDSGEVVSWHPWEVPTICMDAACLRATDRPRIIVTVYDASLMAESHNGFVGIATIELTVEILSRGSSSGDTVIPFRVPILALSRLNGYISGSLRIKQLTSRAVAS